MDNEIHDQALVAVSVFTNEGQSELRAIVNKILAQYPLKRISSVYRIRGQLPNSRHIHDLRRSTMFAGYTVALVLRSPTDSVSLMKHLRSLEEERNHQAAQRVVRLYLLAYGSETMITPQMTLPYPEWHLRPDLLFPATEVWMDYYHPILQQPLQELSRTSDGGDWGEFFGQGKALLDF